MKNKILKRLGILVILVIPLFTACDYYNHSPDITRIS